MGVDLEDEHALAVVAEEGVAVAAAAVGAAAVPGLAVEDEDAAGGGHGGDHVLELQPRRRLREAAAVGPRDHPRGADLPGEVVEHPHRVQHDRPARVEHVAGDVAVEALLAVPRPHDAGVEAAEDQAGAEEVLEDGQGPGMVDGRPEHGVQGGQVGHVPGRAPVAVVGADLPLAADEGPPHLRRLRGREHRLEDGEAVDVDLLHRLLDLGHAPPPLPRVRAMARMCSGPAPQQAPT